MDIAHGVRGGAAKEHGVPVLDSAENRMFHTAMKTIAIGGEKGTVGWVDLWRGVLLCDVLSPERPPKLRDILLPLPARGSWEEFLNYPHPASTATSPLTIAGKQSMGGGGARFGGSRAHLFTDKLNLVIEQHQERPREIYRECMRIHAAKLGTYASHGCCE
ncbi:hypothetical protein HU200_063875 [Digitaria exilis]|uniref:ZF-HD dimerization-type domain-containing protein n=1 Tax=Digitaria exilis TaxID=1010633 RepID=A0A835DYP1_9POAL|nr:hypothetical protein HU200_063875 [Digitaria exilis]